MYMISIPHLILIHNLYTFQYLLTDDALRPVAEAVRAGVVPPLTNQRWAGGHVTALHQSQLTWLMFPCSSNCLPLSSNPCVISCPITTPMPPKFRDLGKNWKSLYNIQKLHITIIYHKLEVQSIYYLHAKQEEKQKAKVLPIVCKKF